MSNFLESILKNHEYQFDILIDQSCQEIEENLEQVIYVSQISFLLTLKEFWKNVLNKS